MGRTSLLFVLSLAISSCKSLSPSAQVHFSEGNAKYGMNDLQGALSEYELAIQLDPTDADVYCNLASVLDDLQRKDESEKNYLTALSIQEYHPSALFNYAMLLQDKRQHKEAAILYERLLTIENGNADALSNLGSCMHELHRYEEAIDAFRNAIQLYESVSMTYPEANDLQSNLYEYMGRCFTKLGNTDSAKESLLHSLRLNKDNMLASHMLAALQGSSSEHAPPEYVSQLFDDYSTSFEESLSELQYVAPNLIVQKLKTLNTRYGAVLDLGSGRSNIRLQSIITLTRNFVKLICCIRLFHIFFFFIFSTHRYRSARPGN